MSLLLLLRGRSSGAPEPPDPIDSRDQDGYALGPGLWLAPPEEQGPRPKPKPRPYERPYERPNRETPQWQTT